MPRFKIGRFAQDQIDLYGEVEPCPYCGEPHNDNGHLYPELGCPSPEQED